MKITSVAAITALASPVRQEIVDTIEALGGHATIAELAAQLGRPADGLYYHVRKLEKVGLVVGSGSPEVYRTPAQRLHLDYARDPAAVRRVIGGMLRIARRDFDRAFGVPGVRIDGADRSLWASRTKGWVSTRELAEINRLLQRILALMHRPKRRAGDRLASWCFVLAPIAAKPARRATDAGSRSRRGRAVRTPRRSGRAPSQARP